MGMLGCPEDADLCRSPRSINLTQPGKNPVPTGARQGRCYLPGAGRSTDAVE